MDPHSWAIIGGFMTKAVSLIYNPRQVNNFESNIYTKTNQNIELSFIEENPLIPLVNQ